MIKKFSRYLTAVLCAALFLTPLYAQDYGHEEHAPEELPPEDLPQELQQNFIIVESVRVHEMNPQVTNYSSDSQFLNGLFEGLFELSPVSLEPQYAIAKDFKISRDKKRWSITLRDDACFSNGEKITAEAVRDSWLRMLANPNAPYSSLFDIVRGAEAFRNGQCGYDEVGIYATSENVLSIYLNNPANYLPKILCHTAFSITHSNPEVYSGAYELEIAADRKYILKKNPYYWGKDKVTLERITFIQSDNPDENAYYYNTGAVDWIAGQVTQQNLLDLSSIQFNATFGTGFLYFKMSSKKPADSKTSKLWDYPEFRNAVLEAFPWEAIHKKYIIPATTLVYPLSGYPQIEGFDYTDAIEASLKMKDAREKYGVPQEEIIPLVMHVFEHEFTEEDEKLMHDAFEPLGIELEIRKIPSYMYYATIASADADILVTSWIGDFADPLAFLELFRSGSTMNDSGWKNEKFDVLLEQAAAASEADRLNLLGQAENILLDDGMVLPLYRSVSSNIVDMKEVGGWYLNAFDIHPLKYLYKKQPKFNAENIVRR